MQTEIFRDDYRRKELCTKQQRNMDLAFERIYNGIQQDSSFGPSSRAGTSTLKFEWDKKTVIIAMGSGKTCVSNRKAISELLITLFEKQPLPWLCVYKFCPRLVL